MASYRIVRRSLWSHRIFQIHQISSTHLQVPPILIVLTVSFLNETGQGVELFFVDNYLAIQTDTKTKSEQKMWKYFFEPKKWYFVCVTHEYHLMRKSLVTLNVNGELVEAFPLIYPKAKTVRTQVFLQKLLFIHYCGSWLRFLLEFSNPIPSSANILAFYTVSRGY